VIDIEPRKSRDEIGGDDRFGEEIIGTGFNRRAAVGFKISTGGDDNAGLAHGGIGAQFAADFEAIGAGHQEVAQDDARAMLPREFNAFIPVAGVENLPAALIQNSGEDAAHVGVVIND
jgi:hypothetical protein